MLILDACPQTMFADIVHLQTLFGAGGLGMGVSAVADCAAKYTRTEGGVVVCADGTPSPLPLQRSTIPPSSQRKRVGACRSSDMRCRLAGC